MLTRRAARRRFILFLLNMVLLLTLLSTVSIGEVFSLKDINGDDIKLLNTSGGYYYEFADSKKEAVFQVGKNVIPLRTGIYTDEKGNITEGTLMRDTKLIVGNKSVSASGGHHIRNFGVNFGVRLAILLFLG